MNKCAIYLIGDSDPDPPIERGLRIAGCYILFTHSVAETLHHLYRFLSASRSESDTKQLRTVGSRCCTIVADVQAGAIPLLVLLHERLVLQQWKPILQVVLFDRNQNDLHIPIQAYELGVDKYLLASDSENQREYVTRVLVESNDVPLLNSNVKHLHVMSIGGASCGQLLQWDSEHRNLRSGDVNVRLNETEARIFSVLVEHQRQTVNTSELVDLIQTGADENYLEVTSLLRSHVMRLRRKLRLLSTQSHLIVNVRSEGYKLV